MNNNIKEVRLQKFLADSGLTSRRKAEKLIIDKQVKVNGEIANIGDKINPEKCKVEVNNQKINYKINKKYYIILNKPRGYITTMNDEQNRRCVADLVKDIPERIYPVGRLDRESEGLLIMTNDGDFANNIIHPSKNIFKKYRVTIRPKITEDQITSLCVGMTVDGKDTAPARVDVVSSKPGRVVLEMSIQEGRNRQIRKMCEQLNLEVARLKRVSIQNLKLGMLQPGKWRELSKEEINYFI